jgi:phosphoribosyl-ATP pyrophosphohydrolase
MPESSIVSTLLDLIAERKANPPAGRSYVVSLLEAGTPRIGAKIIEEAGEVVAAAAEPGEAGRTHLVHEVADLVFHTLVLLGHRDIPWSAVEGELSRRFGVSGIAEKESRNRGAPPEAPPA